MMPLVDRMELSRNYKVRVSYIHLTNEMIHIMSGPVLKIMIQRVLSMCHDPVPNVKINALRALVNICRVFKDRTYFDLATAAVKKCLGDSDSGVVFFADETAGLLNQ